MEPEMDKTNMNAHNFITDDYSNKKAMLPEKLKIALWIIDSKPSEEEPYNIYPMMYVV